MFLYYKMLKHSVPRMYYENQLNLKSMKTPNSSLTKVKFIVLSTDAVMISMYLLPLLYLTKMTHFFLMYYRFLTLRSTYLLGKELQYLTKRHRSATLLNNIKPFKIPVNLLIRHRIPFIFIQYPIGHRWVLNSYRFLNMVFGLYKLQRVYRAWALSNYV